MTEPLPDLRTVVTASDALANSLGDTSGRDAEFAYFPPVNTNQISTELATANANLRAATAAMSDYADGLSATPSAEEEGRLDALIATYTEATAAAEAVRARVKASMTMTPAQQEQAEASAAQLAARRSLAAKDARTPAIPKTQAQLDREYDAELQRTQE